MSERKQSYDEIQSKTVLLGDDEGVNDMLSALSSGRAELDKKKREAEKALRNKKIALYVATFLIVTVTLICLIVVM
ncbi:MAG: hypothetical protein ACOX2F_08495 [bacterium]